MSKVVVRCKVDEDIRNEFESKFPSDYAIKGFIMENAMREILDMTREDPTAEEMVRRAMRNYILRSDKESANGTDAESTSE